MKSDKISCVYYPTTTVLVDDSHRFLSHLLLTLGNNFPCRLYNDPTQALSDVQKNNFLRRFPSDIISTDLESNHYGVFTEKHPVNLDISKLYTTLYDSDRFSQVSIAVVDYAMPKMNGLEFCEQLQDTTIKKIMLTGEADEVVAVNAFNDGLIDKFIVKNQPELGKFLIKSIHELQKQGFQDLSEFVIKALSSEPNICITDPSFINFFDKLCQDLHIVEYYLIDTSGSFLLLDKSGLPTWLIIKNEDEMEDLVMQAVETSAPKPVIEALIKRDKIAYFNKLRDYALVSGNKWESVLYPAQKLGDMKNKGYFYSIVKDLPTSVFDTTQILSLKNYIEKSGRSTY